MIAKHDAGSIIALTAAIRERANAFILEALARRGVLDILPAHGAVLNALFHRAPLQMGAIAEATGRKKNTVTSVVNTLEQRGYCSREVDPADARAQLIALTAKGEAMREIQSEISGELLRKVWEGMDERERDSCIQSLRTILNNLEKDAIPHKGKRGEKHE